MVKTVIEELADFGQSIWMDDISRRMINDGSLRKMISQGLRGMTSNPTIFDKAIKESSAYDSQIKQLCAQADDVLGVYDGLTINDIQSAADMFQDTYTRTKGLDGYVSLEINPSLSDKTDESIEEVTRLFNMVDRPNVMFKIAATQNGFEAIEECTAKGININVTLIFSLKQYVYAAYAYIKGIERLLENKKNVGNVHSVASVFVSRMDTAVDAMIEDISQAEKKPQRKKQILGLTGKAAVSNAAVIYKKYLDILSSKEFDGLKKQGANAQRVLWGSTGTKNPSYSDIKYVSELIGTETVNTVPEKTFQAFLDHGRVKQALNPDFFRIAGNNLKKLSAAGVDINEVCIRLLKDGVDAFVKSFESLQATLQQKIGSICKK